MAGKCTHLVEQSPVEQHDGTGGSLKNNGSPEKASHWCHNLTRNAVMASWKMPTTGGAILAGNATMTCYKSPTFGGIIFVRKAQLLVREHLLMEAKIPRCKCSDGSLEKVNLKHLQMREKAHIFHAIFLLSIITFKKNHFFWQVESRYDRWVAQYVTIKASSVDFKTSSSSEGVGLDECSMLCQDL